MTEHYYTDPHGSAIQVFGHYVSSYLILAHAGFLLGCWVALRRAEAQGVDRRRFAALCMLIYLAAIVGARVLSVVADGYLSLYLRHPFLILAVWRGGLVFYGGFIAAFIAAFWGARRLRLPFGRCADIAAPGIAIGAAIARVGCFLTGCCYGKPTMWPTGIEYRNFALQPRPIGVPLHPSPLYETAFLIPLAYWLARRTRNGGEGRGNELVRFVVAYAIARFAIEFTRADARGALVGLSTSQWISIVLLCASAIWRLSQSRQRQRLTREASIRSLSSVA